jgi:hypothetical protein
MSKKIVIKLSDENARALSREYDELIERKSDALRGQNWGRQADALEQGLQTDSLSEKVVRLLDHRVDGFDWQGE